LRYLADPERLARESPLASAYMLSRVLPDLAPGAAAPSRGEALRSAIRAAAARLWNGPLPQSRDAMLAAIAAVRNDPSDPRYAYVVLELRAFHDYIKPNRMSDIWEHEELIPGSKSQHYRDFDAAVKRLAALLLDMLRPAVRLERPRAPETLYGYSASRCCCISAAASCCIASAISAAVGRRSSAPSMSWSSYAAWCAKRKAPTLRRWKHIAVRAPWPNTSPTTRSWRR
jgi:hypothetical protein